jgi:hypothetical protein
VAPAFFRTTIIDHYLWLTHEARFSCLAEIRQDGIQPRNPGYAVPTLVMETVGPVEGIVCLNPVGSRSAKSTSSGHIFRLAIRSSDLPARISLDWSYPESWDLRNITERQIAEMGKDGSVLYVIDDTGSVGSYDPISSSVLRVCPRGKHGQFPSTWPMLSQVQDDDIMTYDRSGV